MKNKSRVYSSSAENRTRVDFVESIKALEPYFSEPNIVLVDSKLKHIIKPLSLKMVSVYFLEGSEKTKSMMSLNSVLEKIFSNKKFELSKKTKIIVIGGGTLGDFGGFLAHILKRGLELVFVPTTWLSAMDSAHGGKNGINFKNIKNQIGTIYPANKVVLVKSLLEKQPLDRTIEGFGELIKIAYLDSTGFYKQVAREKLHAINLFGYLPRAIDAKYKIVKKDPFETKGIRYLLNFGHTIGHIWEAHFGIHHGITVLLGMYFDFLWAHHRGYRVENDLRILFDSEVARGVLGLFYSEALFSISKRELASLLSADKKKENTSIKYVFPLGHSKMKIVAVRVDEIISEYERQKKLVSQDRKLLRDVSVAKI